MEQFRPHSIDLTQNLSSAVKKKEGIFFTPKHCRQLLIDFIFKQFRIDNHTTLLEPSLGSGEFILDIQEQYPELKHITGVEKNEEIYNNVKDIFDCNIIHDDFLHHTFH